MVPKLDPNAQLQKTQLIDLVKLRSKLITRNRPLAIMKMDKKDRRKGAAKKRGLTSCIFC